MTNQNSQVEESKSLIALASELEISLLESEGEITEQIAKSLAQIAKKVDGSVFVLERFEKIAEHYAEKAQKMADISTSARKAKDRLKEYIKNSMELMGSTELDGEDYRFKISKGPPKVIIGAESDLPKQFITSRVVETPDKKAIGKAIEAGQEVPGASLEYSVTLRVYPKKP